MYYVSYIYVDLIFTLYLASECFIYICLNGVSVISFI